MLSLNAQKLSTYSLTESLRRARSWEELLLKVIDRVSLTEAQYEDILQRYETVAKIFGTSTDPLFKDSVFFPQGSILNRTVIRTPWGTVDVDAIIWLRNAYGQPAMTVYQAVHDELEARARVEAESLNRCIRLKYGDENPAFHMDITAARNAPGAIGIDGHGQLQVPDRRAADYKPSNPRDYAEWLETVSKMVVTVALSRELLAKAEGVEPLPSHEDLTGFDPLRAAIKLMKLVRDVCFKDQMNEPNKPISVILTTLAAKAYIKVVQESAGKPTSPLEALVRIVELMPQFFDSDGRNGGHWVLKNPADKTGNPENFAEKWNLNPALPAAFFNWHQQMQCAVKLGFYDFPEDEQFEEALATVFGAGTKTLARDYLAESDRLGIEPAGLSAAAVKKHRESSATAALFGAGSSQPKPSRPDPMGRLA
jgi:cyclic GMP-AMP synthase DncV-like protein